MTCKEERLAGWADTYIVSLRDYGVVGFTNYMPVGQTFDCTYSAYRRGLGIAFYDVCARRQYVL